MKKIHKDRLLKLARHLEKGKLSHKTFDFRRFSMQELPPEDPSDLENYCGTAGCAIGECPAVFPGEWEMVKLHNTIYPILDQFPTITRILKKDDRPKDFYSINNNTLKSIRRFFGLNESTADHLFAPNRQQCNEYGGKPLSGGATPVQVAKNLRSFVQKFGKAKRATKK
jgi:hypothetical protein